MRLFQLLESANVDLKIISDIADMIVSMLPNEIPSNDTIVLGRLSNTNQRVIRFLNELPEQYHPLVLKLLTKTQYVFNNTEQHMNASEVGVHITDTKTNLSSIVINVSAFVGGYDAIDTKELLSLSYPNKPFKTIESVLVHEMRHGQQHVQYGGHPKSDAYSYGSNPDEIDAAWLHHLNDYNVDSYRTAVDYVKDVMASFGVYKTLNDKQKKHYLKKTATYWYEHHKTSDTSTSIQDRAKTAKSEKVDVLINAVNDTVNISGVNDLRTYDGYPQDSGNFLLPYDNFLKAVSNALRNDADYNDKMIAYIYGFLSLMNNKFDIDVSVAEKILSKKYSVTPSKAIDIIKDEGFGKFDKDFFVSQIQNTF